ncbi:MAG: glycosyltransferase family 4 protein [Lachnospiraceae bacterium]|nr:glycosyltransferase family 4 protein [Lachnospiraceae bacterium]
MEYPIDLPGGGQESTKTLCEGLAADGTYEPVVTCPTLLKTSPSDYDYRIITYPSDENRELSKYRRIRNFLARIGHFRRIIKEAGPDLIHVSMSESLVTFGFLRIPGMFAKIPFVYTDRGLCFGYRRHSKMVIKATMKHAERMLTTTKYNASLWKKEITAPITVIPNTISRAFDGYDPEKRQRLREKYNIGRGVTVIGFAGRISEEKDWGKVPGVVEAIAETGINFKVALVMSVYEERDDKISKSVRDGIAKVTGSDGLIYMQDLSQEEIADYYYLVDIFLMTSSFESFGKAAVEAMSRKCIVLSTSVGGLTEVIGKDEDLYDMNDLSKLAGRVRYLTQHPEEAQAEREYFFARYKDNYTRDKNISRHLDVYREIIG